MREDSYDPGSSQQPDSTGMIVSTLKVGTPRPKRQSRHRPILNCWRGSREPRQLVLKQAAVSGLMQNGLSDLVLFFSPQGPHKACASKESAVGKGYVIPY